MKRLTSQQRMDIKSTGKHTTKKSMKLGEILTKLRANVIHSLVTRLTRSRSFMKALQSTSSLLPRSPKEVKKSEAKRAVEKSAERIGVNQSVSETTNRERIDVIKQRKIEARKLRKIGTTNRSPRRNRDTSMMLTKILRRTAISLVIRQTPSASSMSLIARMICSEVLKAKQRIKTKRVKNQRIRAKKAILQLSNLHKLNWPLNRVLKAVFRKDWAKLSTQSP